MTTDISYLKAGYKKEKWKWVFDLPIKENLSKDPSISKEDISEKYLFRVYDLDKYPKSFPCLKKCSGNAWCLSDVPVGNKSKKVSLTKQLRDNSCPIGLQNTDNTCWINSALQSLFHLQHFRNSINSIGGFNGEESLNSFIYLLQAMFQEMNSHTKRALECSSGSVFEKLAAFATQKVMQKDQDYEVLKCVSEFIENTIDFLLGDPNTGPTFSPLFQTSLFRIARWKCTSCQRNHIRQLSPATSYILAAYVSSDECPLEQCLLDLQTETQTGVWLVCGQDGEGCGASVKVDRVVTPKICSLPSFLIIRNNSLVDSEARRRLHVVYPETLDLADHTYELGETNTKYSLRAVIYHHGYWIKHFSAHVKTEDGKWFNFNDEKVSGLVPQNGIPTETNKNYFSFGSVSTKYKNKAKVRVSRGAFIWIYEKNSVDNKTNLQPPQAVIDYVSSIQATDTVEDDFLLKKAKQNRKNLLTSLTVTSKTDEVRLISRCLLSNWLSSTDLKFQPCPSDLVSGLCEHKKFDSFCSKMIKCIKADKAESLMKEDFGIHSSVPYLFKMEDALCRDCISRDAHHILFREHLKEFAKQVRKEASKEMQPNRKQIGQKSLKCWPQLALRSYLKEHNFLDMKSNGDLVPVKEDEEAWNNGQPGPSFRIRPGPPNESEDPYMDDPNGAASQTETAYGPFELTNGAASSKEANAEVLENGISSELDNNLSEQLEEAKISKTAEEDQPKSDNEEPVEDNRKTELISPDLEMFNQELVCPHNQMDPNTQVLWVTNSTMEKVENYCKESLHPTISSEDFKMCSICEESKNEIVELWVQGKMERKLLHGMYSGKRRPVASRDVGLNIFMVENGFVQEWRSFVRMSERESPDVERPKMIDNSDFICDHDLLKYNGAKDGSLVTMVSFLFEEEWKKLNEFYLSTHTIEATFMESGNLDTVLSACPHGCVEKQAAFLYEEQFNFEWGLIYIRQVNSVADVPSGFNEKEEDLPRKRQKTVAGGGNGSKRAANLKLVRASKEFASNDTLKQVQNFIAERTGIWPILQTMWLRGSLEHGAEPMLLTDDHRNMTLRCLRIKEEDTIYFKAAMEDMEKAAGDGVTEYNELEDLDFII